MLKEFERKLTTFATETVERCNLSLDTVVETIFPTNAYARQKKYLGQGLWKPRALTIRKVYTILMCELKYAASKLPASNGFMHTRELGSA
jgi:hypothetical protein